MNVYVASSTIDCPTIHALNMEKVPHDWLHTQDPFDYGRLFAEVWDRGEPFVLLENDIVPWPGAVEALLACPQPRCTHRFPAAPPGNLALGFGIGKYVPVGPAPDEWRETSWRMLDGFVVPVLNERLGRPHVHEPPVAHARARLGE